MTDAIFSQDHDALAKIFTDDLVFHLRGPHPMAGDHAGLGGLLGVIGSCVREPPTARSSSTQQFCIGTDGWAAEWEHATLGRNGKTLESDNAFVYRFEGDRIAEMWMFLGADARRGRGVLRLTAGRLGETGRMVPAIEDARAACDDSRWGDAWRLLSDARPRRASTSTISTGSPPPRT